MNDPTGTTKLTRRELLFRLAVALYVVCVFALIGSYIAISAVRAGPSIFVQTPQTLFVNRPNAARGVMIDSSTGHRVFGAKAAFAIDGDVIGAGTTKGRGHLHATLTPTQPGTQLDIAIDHGVAEPFTADAPVEVEAGAPIFTWPEGTSRHGHDELPTSRPWEGPFRVQVLPKDGEVPRGLPVVAYLLVTAAESGAPVEVDVTVSKVEGILEDLPQSGRTDALGLMRLPMRAMSSARLTLDLTASESTSTGTVRINTVASQYALEPQQLLVVRGQPVQAVVHSLHRSGGVLADLYDGQHWVSGDAFALAPDGAGVSLVAPTQLDTPLVRLQVYGDMFTAGNAWDSRWLMPGKSDLAGRCVDALNDALQLHQAQNPDLATWAAAALALPSVQQSAGCERRLEAALLAIPPEFVTPHTRFNTKQAADDALEAWRTGLQQRLLTATIGALLVGLCVVILFVLQGFARREEQAAALREVELETAEGDRLQPRIDFERWLLITQSIFVLLTLITFGASVVMLMTWM